MKVASNAIAALAGCVNLRETRLIISDRSNLEA